MDIEKFKSLSAPNQNYYEWTEFIEFAWDYFQSKNIKNPIVVELGTEAGNQRAFYVEILNATYIGIDVNPIARADIHGNTHDPQTLESLKKILAGRSINLLFIDACHEYNAAKSDYEMYAPLVENLIAFHDVKHPAFGSRKLWEELRAKRPPGTCIVFSNTVPADFYRDNMGIGVEVKK